MSWDGIYRPKAHKKTVNDRGVRRPLCSKKLIAKSYAETDRGVNCFACLKKMGVIK